MKFLLKISGNPDPEYLLVPTQSAQNADGAAKIVQTQPLKLTVQNPDLTLEPTNPRTH